MIKINNEWTAMVENSTPKSTDHWGTGVILQDPLTDMVLLAPRVDNGLWGSPGGKVELGETPFNGIIRECKEESNIDIIEMEFYGVNLHSAPSGDWVSFMFYSKFYDDSQLKSQPSEMGQFSYFTVEDALTLDLFPPTEFALKQAQAMGLLDGTKQSGYISFVECPTSASGAMKGVPCQYSVLTPENTSTEHSWLYWD